MLQLESSGAREAQPSPKGGDAIAPPTRLTVPGPLHWGPWGSPYALALGGGRGQGHPGKAEDPLKVVPLSPSCSAFRSVHGTKFLLTHEVSSLFIFLTV